MRKRSVAAVRAERAARTRRAETSAPRGAKTSRDAAREMTERT